MKYIRFNLSMKQLQWQMAIELLKIQGQDNTSVFKGIRLVCYLIVDSMPLFTIIVEERQRAKNRQIIKP